MPLKLTDQQQAIVVHEKGPALVFAVAGSGKTTSMVHRIKHLVDRKVVQPRQILATSFNNAAVKDILKQLSEIGVAEGVDCRTLHSLGYLIIKTAAARGAIDKAWAGRQQDDAGERLINQIMVQLSIEQGMDSTELGLDREDLRNQISIWKGNLAYSDLAKVNLPEEAAGIATQAEHDNHLYTRAYQLYEKQRRQEHLITFDDMLMFAWEILVTAPDILHEIQSKYQMVMVDEFQDVNFAQYKIVDLLAAPHGNYMAIGDDDQCIYEWRGANPRFILEFEETYRARVYTISDNFRSQAQQVILANEVISKNTRRYKKHLSLTSGFAGETYLHNEANDERTARLLVGDIQQLLKSGHPISEIAVLIRLYSQTAFLETAMIEYGMPYRIIGGEPFYRRSELITLFQYLSFARHEQLIKQHGYPQNESDVRKYQKMFQRIINQPRRYLSRDFVMFVSQQSARQGRSIIEIMVEQQDQLKGGSKKKMWEFVTLLRKLGGRLRKTAHKTLQWLVEELDYRNYLLGISGIYEIGITRVQTVEALIEFSRRKGKCLDFLDYIRRISLSPPARKDMQPLTIMTIYRSKGLEWDTVFIPGCNEGLMPCATADDKGHAAELVQDVEAERRLFYVAVTRARQSLHLYTARDKPLSRFLEEANIHVLLEEIEDMEELITNSLRIVRQKGLIRFCRYVGKFQLERFLSIWKPLPQAHRDVINSSIDSLESKIEKALVSEAKKQKRTRKPARQAPDPRVALTEKTEWHRNSILHVRKFKSTYFVVEPGDLLEFELYEDGDIMVLSPDGLVGVIELDKMDGFEAAFVNWPECEGRIEAVSEDGLSIEATFSEFGAIKTSIQATPATAKEADKKPDKQQGLTDPLLQAGVTIIKSLLKSTNTR